MRRLWCILLLCLCWVGLSAQRVSLSLHDAPLSEALRQIDQSQKECRIVFVFNEMERFRITCQLTAMPPLEAVRTVCAKLPIRIKTQGRHVFVEAIEPPASKASPQPPFTHSTLGQVHLLDEVTVVRKRIHYGASGYIAQLEAHGLPTLQALAYLPNLQREGNRLLVHGQEVTQIFLNGMPLSSLDELEQLPADMVEEVRIDYQPCVIHIILRDADVSGHNGAVTYSLLQGPDNGDETGNDGGSLTGVWYMRHRGLSVYERMSFEHRNRYDQLLNAYTLPGTSATHPQATTTYQGETERRQSVLSNRVSVNKEFGQRHSVGASLYTAIDWGSASSEMRQSEQPYYFDGDNHHLDRQLTLRYGLTFGPRNGTLEVLLDKFDRVTKTENLSLYGAGVGTELGESPSITLWRAMADARHPLSSLTTLHYGVDARRFGSAYNPDSYNSNFTGAPSVTQQLDLHGRMLTATLDLEHTWHRLQLSTGLTAKANRLEISPQSADYEQRSLCPHLRLELPLSADAERHKLGLECQRMLDDIPYAALSPTIRWNDPFNFSMGNTSLRAPLSTQLMLHAALWQGLLNVSASYRWVKDEIYWQTSIAKGQTDVFYTQPVNVGHLRILSLQAELNLHPTPWWQAKATAQLHCRMEDATMGATTYVGHHPHQRYTMDHNLRFGHNWMASAHADLEPRYSLYDRTYHTTYHVGCEVQKGWRDNRWQASVMLTPWSRNRRIDRLIEGRHLTYQYLTPPKLMELRVTYNFNHGRRIRLHNVEGGQRYEEREENL